MEIGCRGSHYIPGCFIIQYYPDPLHPPPTAPPCKEHPVLAVSPRSLNASCPIGERAQYVQRTLGITLVVQLTRCTVHRRRNVSAMPLPACIRMGCVPDGGPHVSLLRTRFFLSAVNASNNTYPARCRPHRIFGYLPCIPACPDRAALLNHEGMPCFFLPESELAPRHLVTRPGPLPAFRRPTRARMCTLNISLVRRLCESFTSASSNTDLGSCRSHSSPRNFGLQPGGEEKAFYQHIHAHASALSGARLLDTKASRLSLFRVSSARVLEACVPARRLSRRGPGHQMKSRGP